MPCHLKHPQLPSIGNIWHSLAPVVSQVTTELGDGWLTLHMLETSGEIREFEFPVEFPDDEWPEYRRWETILQVPGLRGNEELGLWLIATHQCCFIPLWTIMREEDEALPWIPFAGIDTEDVLLTSIRTNPEPFWVLCQDLLQWHSGQRPICWDIWPEGMVRLWVQILLKTSCSREPMETAPGEATFTLRRDDDSVREAIAGVIDAMISGGVRAMRELHTDEAAGNHQHIGVI